MLGTARGALLPAIPPSQENPTRTAGARNKRWRPPRTRNAKPPGFISHSPASPSRWLFAPPTPCFFLPCSPACFIPSPPLFSPISVSLRKERLPRALHGSGSAAGCCSVTPMPRMAGRGGHGGSSQLQGLAGGLHTIPRSLQVGERDSRALCSWESTHSIVQQGWCPILEGEMTEGLPAVPVWLQVAFLSQFFREEGEGEAVCSQIQLHFLQ